MLFLNYVLFLANFHEKFIGVTGSNAEIKKLQSQLNVFAEKNADGNITHTAALMLIDPQMRLHAIFTPPFKPQDIAMDLDLLITGKVTLHATKIANRS